MKVIEIAKKDCVNVEDIISITDGQVGIGGDKGVWVCIRQRGFVSSNRTFKSLFKEINE